MSDPCTTVAVSAPALEAYHYPKQYEQFLSEVDGHEMTVLHEDGLHRHLRFARPGTSMWHFDLVTWPGYLAMVGDIGDGYIFRSTDDMLAFFDHGQADGWINPGYWGEKLFRGGVRSVQTFSADRFRAWCAEDGIRNLDFDDIDSTEEAIDALNDGEHAWDFEAPEAWRDFDHHYLLSLHAILWGAKRYHAIRQAVSA